MTDQRELDRLLDAFFVEGTDELSDRVIDSALDEIDHTQQRRGLRMPRRFPTVYAPYRVAAAAVIGVLAVGGLLYFMRPSGPDIGRPSPTVGESSPSTLPAAVSPSSSPGPSSQASTSAPSAKPCPVTVRTGAGLPTFKDEPRVGIGPGRGVFRAGNVLFAAGPGTEPAHPVAQVTPSGGGAELLELSTDGSSVLIRAGYVGGGNTDPECTDLFALRTDGSAVTRLTHLLPGQVVTGAAFSPDGGRVAYSLDPLLTTNDGTISVLDLATNRTVEQRCNDTYTGDSLVHVDWSPGGDRIAVDCHQVLTVFDASGANPPIEFLTDNPLAFSWTDDTHVLVAGDAGAISAADVTAQTTTYLGSFSQSDIDIVSLAGAFSPDGRWLLYHGGERGDVPGNDFTEVAYLVRASGGIPTRIPGELQDPMTWTGEGRSLVYTDDDERGERVLARLDVETLRRSTIGTISTTHPNGLFIRQGVWQIP